MGAHIARPCLEHVVEVWSGGKAVHEQDVAVQGKGVAWACTGI